MTNEQEHIEQEESWTPGSRDLIRLGRRALWTNGAAKTDTPAKTEEAAIEVVAGVLGYVSHRGGNPDAVLAASALLAKVAVPDVRIATEAAAQLIRKLLSCAVSLRDEVEASSGPESVREIDEALREAEIALGMIEASGESNQV